MGNVWPVILKKQPNQGVQLTPLARFVGWTQFTRQNATACWRTDNAQSPAASAKSASSALHGSAARALPGTCLFSVSSTLPTPASGAADARRWPAGGSYKR